MVVMPRPSSAEARRWEQEQENEKRRLFQLCKSKRDFLTCYHRATKDNGGGKQKKV